jgi:hypothetical protein
LRGLSVEPAFAREKKSHAEDVEFLVWRIVMVIPEQATNPGAIANRLGRMLRLDA